MRPRGARCTDRAPLPAPTIWGRLPRDVELRALGSVERRRGSRAVHGALRAPLTWGGSGRSSANAAASPGAPSPSPTRPGHYPDGGPEPPDAVNASLGHFCGSPRAAAPRRLPTGPGQDSAAGLETPARPGGHILPRPWWRLLASLGDRAFRDWRWLACRRRGRHPSRGSRREGRPETRLQDNTRLLVLKGVLGGGDSHQQGVAPGVLLTVAHELRRGLGHLRVGTRTREDGSDGLPRARPPQPRREQPSVHPRGQIHPACPPTRGSIPGPGRSEAPTRCPGTAPTTRRPDPGGPTGCESTRLTRPDQAPLQTGRGLVGAGGGLLMGTGSFWGDGMFWNRVRQAVVAQTSVLSPRARERDGALFRTQTETPFPPKTGGTGGVSPASEGPQHQFLGLPLLAPELAGCSDLGKGADTWGTCLRVPRRGGGRCREGHSGPGKADGGKGCFVTAAGTAQPCTPPSRVCIWGCGGHRPTPLSPAVLGAGHWGSGILGPWVSSLWRERSGEPASPRARSGCDRGEQAGVRTLLGLCGLGRCTPESQGCPTSSPGLPRLQAGLEVHPGDTPTHRT